MNILRKEGAKYHVGGKDGINKGLSGKSESTIPQGSGEGYPIV